MLFAFFTLAFLLFHCACHGDVFSIVVSFRKAITTHHRVVAVVNQVSPDPIRFKITLTLISEYFMVLQLIANNRRHSFPCSVLDFNWISTSRSITSPRVLKNISVDFQQAICLVDVVDKSPESTDRKKMK